MEAGGASGDLAVLGEPGVLAPRTLPGHRVLTLKLLNRGPRPAVLAAADLVLTDESDAPLRATVTFDKESGGPGARVQPKCAALSPGAAVDVVLVWRDADAARLAFPGGAYELGG